MDKYLARLISDLNTQRKRKLQHGGAGGGGGEGKAWSELNRLFVFYALSDSK